MRIGLNLLHALPEIGGGWTYVGSVVDALARFATSVELVAFVQPESEALVRGHPRIRSVVCEVDAADRWRRLAFEHLRLPSLVRQHRLDCVHHFSGTIPLRHRGPAVVTVYDLLVFRDPAAFPVVKRLYLQNLVPVTIRRAAMLLPMSETTARDVMSRFGVERDRVVVVAAPIGDAFRPAAPGAAEAFRAAHGLPAQFWLYVAHGYPHKNHRRLLEAVASRASRGTARWPLVLRGEHLEWVRELSLSLGLGDGVRFLDRLPAQEMPLLFSAAGAMVFPSSFEGAGIPVIEAMACGCPIAASGIPSTLEFAADAAVLFDPLDASAIAGAMDALEGSGSLRASCVERGLEVVERFRPDVAAAQCVKAYVAAVRGRGR